ncbi:KpsF/GutQ family sugar-phosphate isomerase [Pigmentiphaga sp.]|jgi:KpsF/GutQ family protein|uniref:KpsF/GutQ family sugar-phosphate isomerase n=1 Tax=Pigmentiphaga sp. TaxID=1977564 RepID=UPI0025E35A42|nr:KpsF/GutQ family sugar-phosphate isomerase [Pigmentiphaga sp.]MBX6318882.1 KpsF/GutQ family sugar-phosphate isomerase [Pigmentiphaga sp.]
MNTSDNGTSNPYVPGAPGSVDVIGSARSTLAVEIEALQALSQRLDRTFERAVDMILGCRGRVVVSGIGKSGHIARKVAATLASTGTPAFFVHAAEAVHGDLGMITANDVLIAISYSGTTAELLTIVPVVKRLGSSLIAITGNPDSELAQLADLHLDASVPQEACPMNLAPTASTTTALALGDALAVACLEARGFGPEDFARSHPGGALGRRLLTHVRDVMRTGRDVPTVQVTASVTDALEEITRKSMGMTAVLDGERLVGIFTDGDLRRLIEREGDIRHLTVVAGMTRNPLYIGPDALATEAAALMDENRKNQLLVLDASGKLVGALHTHDLMAAKVL